MRILIDLQGAQSESRFRGIGRYSLALALGVARNAGEHEIWIVLNGGLPGSIADLRAAFDPLVPPERIRVFDIAAPSAEIDPANSVRCRASELLREHFIEQLAPDAVLVTSLFEGYIDDAVVSAGRFAGAAHTAVVLYDLIPFLNPAAYLGTPAQRDHYAGKIASLKRAGLLLAISDYTRQEAIGALGLAPERVVAISTAVDDSFIPAAPGPDLAPLLARLGITRPSILYAPGGFDSRKNLDGLIIAYSLLTPELRACHQLVIVSRLGSHDAQVLRKLANKHGLQPDELILTGYVSDVDLIALYRSTALFVFPSKHEGFGLPALEAMSCGALVIGGDNTSIPEVIGCREALFNAASPASIAAKIIDVLEQPVLRERLREHGRQQVAKFSWDATACKALRAIEAHAARAEVAPRARRHLGVVAAPSGSRFWQLAPALLDAFDVAFILPIGDSAVAPELAGYTFHPPAWLLEHGHSLDQLIYVFDRHTPQEVAGALFQRMPGIVLLDGFSAIAAPGQPGTAQGQFRAHGYRALAGAASRNPIDDPDKLALLATATQVITTSQEMYAQALHAYGAAAVHDWEVLPADQGASALIVALDRADERARHGRRALLHALADVPGLEADPAALSDIALALARTPAAMHQRQLMIDLSACRTDSAPPGLQAWLLALIAHSGAGIRVEPVFLEQDSEGGQLRYARTLTTALLAPGVAAPAADALVDWAAGDVLLDPLPDLHTGADGDLRAQWHAFLRGRGVRVDNTVGFTARDPAQLLAWFSGPA
ncbi:glycosyltransferase family 4 protein [Massilia sp. S19_KUP03_FR1]|uniref:glycosyltransferase family 4 protein n=1 Tax=Massilia sp. S19_KUP03_FR1 TaxID=3025503 RepID=UPI002FCDA8D1